MREGTSRSDLETFRKFRNKFKVIDLPFVYRQADFKDGLDFEKLPTIKKESSDTPFVKSDYPDGVKCYGLLRDTSKYFAFISFFPGDSYFPVLTTFDRNGKFIGHTSLIANGCGGDCGLQYCSMSSIINKDFSIFCADTVKWEYFCDSLAEPIPNSDIIWVDSKKGHLQSDGSIKMRKQTHEEFKNSR
jgi:hypothetical protein